MSNDDTGGVSATWPELPSGDQLLDPLCSDDEYIERGLRRLEFAANTGGEL